MSFSPSPEAFELQRLLAGRFSLERELGRGGMGIVFLARDVALDRPVAIKLLPAALAVEPELRERFLREARTAAKLSHPNVVPIHLVEAHGSVVFFVMTFVDGETLGQRVRRSGPLTASQATRLVQEVAWALAYAHLRGVVHRDVKPDNILLDKDSGRAMVTDFGIARVADASAMSGSGEVLGTAHYMSPEQASGEAVDGRSDLFSLGITAYYALTGRLPFDGPHLPAVVARIVNAAPTPMAELRHGVPRELAAAVERCLEKKREDRYADGEQLAAAVGTVADQAEVAPQVRFLLKSMQGIDLFVGMVLATLFALPNIVITLWANDRMTLALLAFLAVTLVGSQFYSMVYAARQAIKAGLGPADARRALEREGQSRREAAEAVLGGGRVPETSDQMLARRKKWLTAGHWLMAISVVPMLLLATTNGPRGPQVGVTILAIMSGLGAYLGASALKRAAELRGSGRRLPQLGLAEQLFARRALDPLFRLAGWGLKVEAQNAPPVAERTEVFVAAAATALFAQLTPAMRERFADAPDIVSRLRKRADALRRKIAGLDPAVDAASGATDRERLATTVAALEMIRLDLLRLQSGTGTPDDLTADLEKARELSTAVDAELHGRAAVAALLAERRAK